MEPGMTIEVPGRPGVFVYVEPYDRLTYLVHTHGGKHTWLVDMELVHDNSIPTCNCYVMQERQNHSCHHIDAVEEYIKRVKQMKEQNESNEKNPNH
jgi:hypothetical protein